MLPHKSFQRNRSWIPCEHHADLCKYMAGIRGCCSNAGRPVYSSRLVQKEKQLKTSFSFFFFFDTYYNIFSFSILSPLNLFSILQTYSNFDSGEKWPDHSNIFFVFLILFNLFLQYVDVNTNCLIKIKIQNDKFTSFYHHRCYLKPTSGLVIKHNYLSNSSSQYID